jgi:energy-converting hydrogenase B subunit D
MTLQLAFDIVLIVTVVVCAWAALTTPDLLRAIVLFIAFGLLLALVWVRLQAPDVALAEAAVGSGLTGALLLSTLSAMRRRAAQTSANVSAEMHEVESKQEAAVAQDT